MGPRSVQGLQSKQLRINTPPKCNSSCITFCIHLMLVKPVLIMFFFFFFYFVPGRVTKNLVSEDEHVQMSISLCLFFMQETEPGYLFWQCLILLNGNWWTYLWQIKSIASLYTLFRTLKKPGSTYRLYKHIYWIKINRFYLKKKHNNF